MKARRPLLLGAGAALLAQWAPALAGISSRAARLIDVPTTIQSERGVLLTFDDGPHPRGTPAVLEALDRRRAPAVFFVSGEQALRHPRLVSEIAAAGHEIGVHGYRHQTRRQWSARLLSEDTLRALDALSRAVPTAPRLYRPPHGVLSSTGLRTVRSTGLMPLLWSKWGRDWERRATHRSIAQRVTDGIEAGDVVLLHDADHYAAPGSWRKTAASIALILELLDDAGLEPASVLSGTARTGLALTS